MGATTAAMAGTGNTTPFFGSMTNMAQQAMENSVNPQTGDLPNPTAQQVDAANANLANIDYNIEANPVDQEATEVTQTAFGAVPTVTTGSFSPQTQNTAQNIFGTETDRQKSVDRDYSFKKPMVKQNRTKRLQGLQLT